jgi:hypothetical protein
MQQQAETVRTLKLMEQANQMLKHNVRPAGIIKKVTFAQAAMSDNDQRNERRYSRRESPARSVSPSERSSSDTRSNYVSSQSPVRYSRSDSNNTPNAGRLTNPRRDGREATPSRQVWHSQWQWSSTSSTGTQQYGPQTPPSKSYNTSRYRLNENSRFVEVDSSDRNLQVTIFQGEENEKATLNSERWAYIPRNDVAYSSATSRAVVSATMLSSTGSQRTGTIIFIIIVVVVIIIIIIIIIITSIYCASKSHVCKQLYTRS